MPAEKAAVQCDWATLQFANGQRKVLDHSPGKLSVHESRVPLLLQIPGMRTLLAMTILSAVGPIERFPDASHVVGYSGLGVKVHDSGETHHTGGITKFGRKDLRAAMVAASQHTVKCHPY